MVKWMIASIMAVVTLILATVGFVITHPIVADIYSDNNTVGWGGAIMLQSRSWPFVIGGLMAMAAIAIMIGINRKIGGN